MGKPGNWREVVGHKFNRLTILKEIGRKDNKIIVECVCECGGMIKTRKTSVTSGITKSCGCLYREGRKRAASLIFKHGMCDTITYRSWANMKTRCNKSNHSGYKNYGARGIKVCEDWVTFENFYKDMGDRPSSKHSIERIDNNGNYEPSNCRWATTIEQCNNTRKNIEIEFYGTKLTIAEWSRVLNLPYYLLRNRLNTLKWSVFKSFMTPARGRLHD